MIPTKKVLQISIAIFLVILLALGIYLIKVYIPNLQNSPSDLLKCNTLQYSGDGAIDLLFFSTKEITHNYADYLFSSEPYKNYKDRFNIYYIDSYTPECENYKGIATLCQSKDLTKKSVSCPNDYVLVPVKNLPKEIRSSAYLNVISLNLEHSDSVLLHELGHVLANLADEYIPSKLPRGQKNCVSSCDDFSSPTCFSGCSDESHQRSCENCIMRTLSSETYGEFNDKIVSQSIEKQTSEFNPSITGNQIAEQDGTCVLVEFVKGIPIIKKVEGICKESRVQDPTIIFTDALIDGETVGEALTVNIEERSPVYIMKINEGEDFSTLKTFTNTGTTISTEVFAPSTDQDTESTKHSAVIITLSKFASSILPENQKATSENYFAQSITKHPSKIFTESSFQMFSQNQEQSSKEVSQLNEPNRESLYTKLT